MIRMCDKWKSKFSDKRAIWTHDGNPKRPHALLTSGMHSDRFFRSDLVLEDPVLLDEACFDLVDVIAESCGSLDIVDRVVGPAMGAITLANNMARHISLRQIRGINIVNCLSAYTEKEEEGDLKMMVFRRTKISAGERILLCEDALSTGGSIELAVDLVSRLGGIVLPFVVVLVNRSGLTEVSGNKILALVDLCVRVWSPNNCPYCGQGSEAIRPKGVENWERLHATY